jgi:high affinity sulfate transporter 1
VNDRPPQSPDSGATRPKRASLVADVLAGLTTAAVVVPKSMAYATIAGLPVQVGLYTACVPLVVYALLGSSAVLSTSTTTTIAILTGAELAQVAPQGGTAELLQAAATLSVLVGAALLLASVLRLGFLANFISEPVLTGFKTGIGIVIVADQLPKLLGIHFDKGGILENLVSIVRHVPETSSSTLLLALGTLLAIVLLERFTHGVPAPLVVVALGIAAAAVFGLDQSGVETVGEIPRGLPTLQLPRLDLVAQMWPAALGIALMSFTESIAAGRAFRAAGERRPGPNRELLAVGAANAVGGLFGAMPAGGGTSQTAVNRRAGARTQLSGIVGAVVALATLLLLAPVLSWMPQATLAAVVVAYSIELIQPHEFRAIRAVRALEFRWALVACVGVVLLGTLKGILIAVIVSMLALVHQANDVPVYELVRKRGTQVFRRRSPEHPDDETFPGLLLLRMERTIYFGNAQRASERLQALIEEHKPKVVVLDMSAVPDLEYTALKMLDEGEARMRSTGVAVWLAALNSDVLEIIRSSPLGQRLGREQLHFTVELAVEAYAARPPAG